MLLLHSAYGHMAGDNYDLIMLLMSWGLSIIDLGLLMPMQRKGNNEFLDMSVNVSFQHDSGTVCVCSPV